MIPARSAVAAFAALFAITLGVACRQEQTVAPTPLPTVSLAPVKAVDLADRIEAVGELVAKERAEIAVEVSGRVTEILIDEGSWLAAGSEMLTIDPERRKLELDSARAALNEARANQDKAKRELVRIERLRERTVASQTVLDQAQTELMLARSRVVGAEASFGVARRALSDATVTAPFAGLIARRWVSRGEYVNAGQKLFELVSLDPIEVEFHVVERDSSRVRLGQTVRVRVAPFPDRVFQAVVSIVSPTIDPETRTLRVKGLMSNRDGTLRPGLFAHVDLGIASRRGVAVIPEIAVMQRTEGAVVFRFGPDDRVERRIIELGVIRDGIVEVVSGLEPGDLVVARGHNRLVDGDLVTPRDPEGNPIRALRAVADAGELAP